MNILYINKNLALESFAIEALNRYIASILYGLIFSILFIFVVALILYNHGQKNSQFLLSLTIFYLIPLLPIIRNYRLSRIKELEMVFTATFIVKDHPKFPKR